MKSPSNFYLTLLVVLGVLFSVVVVVQQQDQNEPSLGEELYDFPAEQLKKPVNRTIDCLPRQFDAKKLYLQALTSDVRRGPTLLVGVMSMVELTRARDKMRSTLRPLLVHLHPRVALKFVVGEPTNISTALKTEMSIHEDIMILRGSTENMNEGKTYYYLRQAFEDYHYDYVMKTDHDALINLPLYLQYLPSVPTQTYMGRAGGAQCNFMVGGGYTVSRDVLSWVHTLNVNKTSDLVRSEDMLLVKMFSMLGFAAVKLKNWINMVDHYVNYYKIEQVKSLRTDYTLIAHRLKTDEMWDFAASIFTQSELWKNITSRGYK